MQEVQCRSGDFTCETRLSSVCYKGYTREKKATRPFSSRRARILYFIRIILHGCPYKNRVRHVRQERFLAREHRRYHFGISSFHLLYRCRRYPDNLLFSTSRVVYFLFFSLTLSLSHLSPVPPVSSATLSGSRNRKYASAVFAGCCLPSYFYALRPRRPRALVRGIHNSCCANPTVYRG